MLRTHRSLIVQPCDEDEQFFSFVLVMDHQWSETDRGKPKYSGGEKLVPVPLCPPQIPHVQTPVSNPDPRGESPATNGLSHGTALTVRCNILTAVLLIFRESVRCVV